MTPQPTPTQEEIELPNWFKQKYKLELETKEDAEYDVSDTEKGIIKNEDRFWIKLSDVKRLLVEGRQSRDDEVRKERERILEKLGSLIERTMKVPYCKKCNQPTGVSDFINKLAKELKLND